MTSIVVTPCKDGRAMRDMRIAIPEFVTTLPHGDCNQFATLCLLGDIRPMLQYRRARGSIDGYAVQDNVSKEWHRQGPDHACEGEKAGTYV